MDFLIELDGRGPAHAQLTRALKQAILDGRLRAQTKLPPTRTLAVDLRIARNTVLSAYEQLRAEGFIESRVGSGSYVAPSAAVVVAAAAPKAMPAQSRYARRLRTVLQPSTAASPNRLRYNLQYGEPLLNPKLTSTWRRELSQAAAYTKPGYPRTQGLPELRQAICDYLARRRGIQVEIADVMIVNGTQQAMSLTARVLLDEGDSVVVEDPQYFGVRKVMQTHGARLVPVPVDAHGIECEKLPKHPPKLVCVTPSHQFPLGSVLSLPRRLELLSYAARKRCWILEDDYDSEFRYNAQPLAALRALDQNHSVIYVGSFSKVILPSLRLGYMLLPRGLSRDFVAAKWMSDLGSPAIEQAALANFMSGGAFERHLRQSGRMLNARRSALTAALHRHAPQVEVGEADAGMHLVCWLPGYDQARLQALVELAHSRGLGLHTIAPLYLKADHREGLLLGYAGLSVAQLEAAIRLFGQCLRDVSA